MHPQFLYVLPANTTIYSVSILHICMCTGEAQFERHRFLTGFWVPKMVPKILQANLIFYVVFATLASQTVLAEKLKVFKNARRDASSPVLTKPPREQEECYF